MRTPWLLRPSRAPARAQADFKHYTITLAMATQTTTLANMPPASLSALFGTGLMARSFAWAMKPPALRIEAALRNDGRSSDERASAADYSDEASGVVRAIGAVDASMVEGGSAERDDGDDDDDYDYGMHYGVSQAEPDDGDFESTTPDAASRVPPPEAYDTNLLNIVVIAHAVVKFIALHPVPSCAEFRAGPADTSGGDAGAGAADDVDDDGAFGAAASNNVMRDGFAADVANLASNVTQGASKGKPVHVLRLTRAAEVRLL